MKVSSLKKHPIEFIIKRLGYYQVAGHFLKHAKSYACKVYQRKDFKVLFLKVLLFLKEYGGLSNV